MPEESKSCVTRDSCEQGKDRRRGVSSRLKTTPNRKKNKYVTVYIKESANHFVRVCTYCMHYHSTHFYSMIHRTRGFFYRNILYYRIIVSVVSLFISVAEPKLFIFGSGSTFVHNFCSGSSSSSSPSHILPLKTVLKEICLIGGFLHPSILQTNININCKDNFGSGSGIRSQIISAPPAPTPAPQHWFKP